MHSADREVSMYHHLNVFQSFTNRIVIQEHRYAVVFNSTVIITHQLICDCAIVKRKMRRLQMLAGEHIADSCYPTIINLTLCTAAARVKSSRANWCCRSLQWHAPRRRCPRILVGSMLNASLQSMILCV